MMQLRRLSFACLSATGLLACNDDGGTTTTDATDATTQGDTASEVVATTTDTGPTDTVTPTGTSALTGVKWDVPGITAPTPNAACATAGTQVLTSTGVTYPWGGLTAGGTTYTCNGCPQGHPDMQGRWRVHGFEETDLNNVDYSFYSDSTKDRAVDMFVDGNTFMFTENDETALQTVTVSRGWYFCSMKPENGAQHLFWTNLDAQGVNSDTYETDVVLAQGGNNVAWFFFHELGGDKGIWYAFCRIGSTANGTTCNDPFVH